MSMISPVAADPAVVYPPLMAVAFRATIFESARLALISSAGRGVRQSMGCNVLALAPGSWLMLEGNPETRRRLEAAGVRC